MPKKNPIPMTPAMTVMIFSHLANTACFIFQHSWILTWLQYVLNLPYITIFLLLCDIFISQFNITSTIRPAWNQTTRNGEAEPITWKYGGASQRLADDAAAAWACTQSIASTTASAVTASPGSAIAST
jgi:hypothetical protein